MRAILTRVKSASVTIDGECVGKIGKGFLFCWGLAQRIPNGNAGPWQKRLLDFGSSKTKTEK